MQVLPLVWEAQAQDQPLAVEAPAGAGLGVEAARSGTRVVARVIYLGDRPAGAAVTVRGLGGRRLAGEGEHFTAGLDAKVVQGKLRVADGAFRLALRPRTVHVVVLRLEDRPK